MVKLRVYEMMAQCGFRTRKALAEAAGMTEANIGKLVKGEVARVELRTIDALCRVFECQPGDLLEYVPERQKRRAKKAKR